MQYVWFANIGSWKGKSLCVEGSQGNWIWIPLTFFISYRARLPNTGSRRSLFILFGAALWASAAVVFFCCCLGRLPGPSLLFVFVLFFCLDVDRNGKHPASSCTAFIGSIGTSLQSPTRPMIVRDFWRCPSTSLDLIQCQPMANTPGRNVQLLQLTERSSGQGERKMMEAPTKWWKLQLLLLVHSVRTLFFSGIG